MLIGKTLRPLVQLPVIGVGTIEKSLSTLWVRAPEGPNQRRFTEKTGQLPLGPPVGLIQISVEIWALALLT